MRRKGDAQMRLERGKIRKWADETGSRGKADREQADEAGRRE